MYALFEKEDPWMRLKLLREALPNILTQMLLRSSNAVGYTAYPDNLVADFIVKSAENGMDIFRIFDSLNWTKSMALSIQTVRNETNSIAEACICYTGDILNPNKQKFNLAYYVDLAKELEDMGAHILAIKDMAAAPLMLRKINYWTQSQHSNPDSFTYPRYLIHSSGNVFESHWSGRWYYWCFLSSMSGLTSQPNFNSIVNMLKGHERECKMDLKRLNEFSKFWEDVREYYYPFESELKAGTAQVYENEIPSEPMF